MPILLRWKAAAVAGAAACGMAALAAQAAGPAQATEPSEAARVSVQLVQPARFTDAGYRQSMASPAELEQMRRAFEAALQPLAARALPAGDTLSVEVLDVDLAGELDPFRSRGGSELRVLREITWPRITLRYTLGHDGAVAASGEQRLSDLDYLHSRPVGMGATRYEFETRLLRRWFEQNFGDSRPPQ